MKTGASFKRGKSSQDYVTPSDFFLIVESKFGPMNFDLAADENNAKCSDFFNKEFNALDQDWSRLRGHLWLNPPFDDIAPWAKKCAETLTGRGIPRVIYLLVPASVGSNWFRDYVYNKSQVFFLNGRLCFDPAHPKWGYPKDLMLAVYGQEYGMYVWDWKIDRL